MASVRSSSGEYSRFWGEFLLLHMVCTMCFGLLFWSVYAYCGRGQTGMHVKDRLLISTNVISIIHGIIVFYGALIAFFLDDLSAEENIVFSQPGWLSYVWVVWNSYMLADLAAHLILYYHYDATQIERRYDILAHHVVSYLMLPAIQYPVPIYGWFVFVWPPITELSTIFLNLQWFSKYYRWDTCRLNIAALLNVAFHVCWFCVRLPALCVQLIWLSSYWHDLQLWPERARLTCIAVAVVINVLNIVWTFFIAKDLCCQSAEKKRK